jgi:uncharacterized cysteine cluster protein YcgN (CxxCxxCC family)
MENGTDLESLCRKCGLCCHAKTILHDGTYIIHPTLICKFLDEKSNTCVIYSKRFTINPNCPNIQQVLEQDYILPEDCPYTHLRAGYKGAKIVSIDEFNEITLEEILKGNQNLLKLCDDLLSDPSKNYKMIELSDINEDQ